MMLLSETSPGESVFCVHTQSEKEERRRKELQGGMQRQQDKEACV